MRNPDHPTDRRIVLASPAHAIQSVNWITVNSPKKLAGWPDAGGYPSAEAIRSKAPRADVRDLTLRLRLSGTNVPKGAVPSHPPGPAAPGHGMGIAGVRIVRSPSGKSSN